MSTKNPAVIMIGSDPSEQGGIGSVLSTYLNHGFLDDKIFLVSHREGPALSRVLLFLQCLGLLLWHLLTTPSIAIVHMHMSERGSFFRKAIMGTIAHLFGKKAFYHLHGAEFLLFYENLSSLHKFSVRHTLNTAEGIFVLSESWKQDLKAVTANSNVYVVYNPVSYNAELAPRLNEPDAKVNCIFLGRYGRRKGIYDLIQAVATIPHPNFQITLHGDGELDKVKEMIRELKLEETIQLGGWIRGEEKHQALLKADILLLPSYNEGLPVAILEALAYGQAVISTPVGGIAEAVQQNRNGLLVPPGDISALAAALQSLTTNPALLNQMKLESRALCKDNFAHLRIFNLLESLYERIGITTQFSAESVA
jgi:glycosyltransferase involved in cell wall biosynthesis